MMKPINLRNLRYEVSCFVNLSMGFPHRILKMLTSGSSFVKPPVVVFLDNMSIQLTLSQYEDQVSAQMMLTP